MVVIINERQASEMLAAADSIYKFFAFAEGQDESHEARRAEWESAQEEIRSTRWSLWSRESISE